MNQLRNEAHVTLTQATQHAMGKRHRFAPALHCVVTRARARRPHNPRGASNDPHDQFQLAVLDEAFHFLNGRDLALAGHLPAGGPEKFLHS